MNSNKLFSRRATLQSILSLGISIYAAPVFANSGFKIAKYKAIDGIKNAASFPVLNKIKMGGWLGNRFELNAKQRMMNVDLNQILAGYRKKPGEQAWVGEHIGKYIHAATLTWAQTNDPDLKLKLDEAVNELIKTQEEDAYLGTYLPKDRFSLNNGADWDVWSHKYCMIGLLTYYQYCDFEPALKASQKAADLMVATFPHTKSINDAGTHKGMAATSILEPIIMLYRFTNDKKYLEFAKYIVNAMGEDKGSKIIESLELHKGVNEISNAKAYEMLSNMVGLCEYLTITKDKKLLENIQIAWQDIVDKRLYITGTASSHEHFQKDHILPHENKDSMGETCVTTTWIQLNLALLKITADAKYGNELEKSYYNHLSAAQHLNGNDWCYYTPLEGKKPYDKHVTCCHSSGPRGIALSPISALFVSSKNNENYIHINSFDTISASFDMPDNTKITIIQKSAFPSKGQMTIEIKTNKPVKFAFKIREPNWAKPINISNKTIANNGWLQTAKKTWKNGDKLVINFNLSMRENSNPNYNLGKKYSSLGPFILAEMINDNNETITPNLKNNGFKPNHENKTEFTNQIGKKFLTFADIGNDGAKYRVWYD